MEALPLCRQIGDANLRGECLAGIAFQMGLDGQTVCEEIAVAFWKDDCYFMIAEARGSIGDEAQALCANAGRFRSHCIGHALGRAACTEPFLLGGEREALQALQELVRAYNPQILPHGRKQLARKLLSKCIADRWDDLPTPEQCGEASDGICRLAVQNYLRRQANPDEICENAGDWLRAACPP